jgi:hypothetical protein
MSATGCSGVQTSCTDLSASHFFVVDISAVDRLTNDWHAIIVGHQYGCFKCFSSISTSSWQLRQFRWERWSDRPAEYWQHSKSGFAVSAVSSYHYKQCHCGNYSEYSFWYWVKVLWRHLIFDCYKCLGQILIICYGGVHLWTLVFVGFLQALLPNGDAVNVPKPPAIMTFQLMFKWLDTPKHVGH